MYLEREAILTTMLALADLGIPSLSVQDSIIVPQDSAELLRMRYHVEQLRRWRMRTKKVTE